MLLNVNNLCRAVIMYSGSNVVKLFRPEGGKLPGPSSLNQSTKRGAQLEDGYTRIANELLEAVTNAQICPVTIRQMRVVLAVVRMTYGFQKKSDRISDGQIAKETGLSRQNVNVAKHQLIEMKVLFLDGKKLGVNKHFQDWDFTKKQKNNNLIQTRDTVSKSETQNVSKPETHQRKKENKDLSKDKSTCPEKIPDEPSKVTKVRPDAAVQTPEGRKWGTQADLDIARRLADDVAKILGGEKDRRSDQELCEWANEIRLFRTRPRDSGRHVTHEHMLKIWNFAHENPFWNKNLQSPHKLRHHWGKLVLDYKQAKQSLAGDSTHATGQPRTEYQRQRAEVDAAINNWQDTSWADDFINNGEI